MKCHHILVELQECALTIDGEDFPYDRSSSYTADGGVVVMRDNETVVVRVPDGGRGGGLTLEVECEVREVFDGEEKVETPMLMLRVTRRLTPSDSRVAHGLLGAFTSLSVGLVSYLTILEWF